jgi:hypothetical protein
VSYIVSQQRAAAPFFWETLMISVLALLLGLGAAAQLATLFASSKLALAYGPAVDVTAPLPARTGLQHNSDASGAADPAWASFMRGM